MTADPRIEAVEFDLPGIMREKREIVESILRGSGVRRDNLHLCEGNALDSDALAGAVSGLEGPVAIAKEGLLRYLSRAEQKTLAQNIYRILSSKGGLWVTPDIITRTKVIYDDKARERRQMMSKMTGTDIERNMFEDTTEARKLFEGVGFEVAELEIEQMKDVLVSPEILKLEPERVTERLRGRVAFVMKVRR